MQKTGGDVAEYVSRVTPAKRRRDAETMIAMLRDVSGREPELWGSIIGFGSCHYRYPTGTEGDAPVLAFAPRKQATTIYLLSTEAHDEELQKLGPNETGVGCLYIKDLEEVDAAVLRGIVESDYRRVVTGDTGYATFTVTD